MSSAAPVEEAVVAADALNQASGAEPKGGDTIAADHALYFDVDREGQSFVATLTQGQTVTTSSASR
jgi:hypothetical protein